MEVIGAAISNLVSGFVVVFFGFKTAFLFLAVIAIIALGIFWIGIPETKGYNPHSACCAGDFFIFLILSGLQNLDW
ncbi:MAG: hypothetical protein WB791_08705 [Waddliaceae bacterium]